MGLGLLLATQVHHMLLKDEEDLGVPSRLGAQGPSRSTSWSSEVPDFWPDRKRRDTHNRIKELMDVLQAADAFADDCQALARERDFRIDAERPRVEIAVRRRRA